MLTSHISMVFVLCLAYAASIKAESRALISKRRFEEIKAEYRKNARRTDMTRTEIAGVMEAADEIEEKEMELSNGKIIREYDLGKFERRFSEELGECMSAMVRAGKNADEQVAKVKESVIRRPADSDTAFGTVARWFGMEQTIRQQWCGECDSGCHYCCINRGAAGLDVCFGLYCGGIVDCD